MTPGRKFLVAAAIIAMLGGGVWLAYLAVRKPVVRLMLVPGRSMWEVADKLEASRFGSRQEVLALAANEVWVRSLDVPLEPREPRSDGVETTWLEGFVYPDTYELAEGSSAREVLSRAVLRFKQVWGGLRSAHAARLAALERDLGLSEFDVIVLASLVEKEMAIRSEAPVIAGVFLNRLARNMKLETDPTLLYRPDRVGKVPSPKERRDETNPYNTYSRKGLPPGPICSPSRDALEGVLKAEQHDFLFFVARRDGTRGHAFAKTYEEHRANIERFLKKPRPE